MIQESLDVVFEVPVGGGASTLHSGPIAVHTQPFGRCAGHGVVIVGGRCVVLCDAWWTVWLIAFVAVDVLVVSHRSLSIAGWGWDGAESVHLRVHFRGVASFPVSWFDADLVVGFPSGRWDRFRDLWDRAELSW
jgi:hypothetical protein